MTDPIGRSVWIIACGLMLGAVVALGGGYLLLLYGGDAMAAF